MSSKGKRDQMQFNMFSFARTVLILSVLIFFFFPSHLRLYQNKQTKKKVKKNAVWQVNPSMQLEVIHAAVIKEKKKK